jgi:hypothetical protein
MSTENWPTLPLADYALAAPRAPGELGVELLVQARPSGRLTDHFRFTIDGSKRLTASFTSQLVFLSPMLPASVITIQLRPNEIQFRQNTTTSEWIDLCDGIRARDFLVDLEGEDSEEEESNDDFVALLDSAADKSEVSASVRWALTVNPDGLLALELQALPASAATLNSKPALKGYVLYSLQIAVIN